MERTKLIIGPVLLKTVTKYPLPSIEPRAQPYAWSYLVLSCLSPSTDGGRSPLNRASAVWYSFRHLPSTSICSLHYYPQNQKLNFVSSIERVVYYYVDFFVWGPVIHSGWRCLASFTSVSTFQGFPWYWHFHCRNLKNVQLYAGHETLFSSVCQLFPAKF